ncbi:MAG TPA: YciI family protein [Myxococcota bacterium]|jgi:hypothetical protein
MQYALLYYTAGNPVDALSASERDAWYAEMKAWRAELQRAGVFRTGMRLSGVDTATSLRREGSEVLVTDGPFAETKEILGGLTVIECSRLDEALAWARRCPIARVGTVEVRPEFAAPR